MYSYAVSEKDGLLVGIHGGPLETDEDFGRNVESGRELDRLCRGRRDYLIWICLTDPGARSPSATQRKRMADSWKEMKAPNYGFCLVTSSSLVAGALTAVSWVLPKNPSKPTVYKADFAQSVTWAETLRGTPLPQLKELERQARAALPVVLKQTA